MSDDDDENDFLGFGDYDEDDEEVMTETETATTTETFPFVKTGHAKRVQREAHFYRHLRSVNFVGCPRYGGMRSVRGKPKKKQLLLERMKCSLESYEKQMPDYIPDFPDAYKRIAKREHYVKDSEAMCPLLDVSDFWDKAYQLCVVLASLHRNAGLCHRDVKPQNVCVDESNYLSLIDFEMCALILDPPGSRFSASRESRMNSEEWSTFRGTRIYAPPEMVCDDRKRISKEYGGLPYGVECETWSYGVTLLEMFSGVDLNSIYVVESHMSQVALNETIDILVDARPSSMTLCVQDYTLLRQLLLSCLHLNWKSRHTMEELVSHPSFTKTVSARRRKEIRAHYKYE